MSLLFAHGLDGVADGDVTSGLFTTSTGLLLHATQGRFGGQALRSGNFDGNYWQIDFSDETTVIFSGAFKPAGTYHGTSARREFVNFHKDATQQVYLRAESNGRIRAYRGDNTLLGETAGQALNVSTYHWLSCKVVFSDTVGAVELEVNEQNVLNLTNQDTQNGATGCNQIRLRGCSTTDSYWDDPIVCNDAGSKLNGILKDRRIYELLPTADTAQADFTRSGGTTNVENVDDATPDGDSTYVESSTAAHQDIYTLADLPADVGSVDAVIMDSYARKDDAGTRSLRSIIKSNTDTDTQDDALSTDFLHYLNIAELDPQGSGNWTVARVNAAEIGIEVV